MDWNNKKQPHSHSNRNKLDEDTNGKCVNEKQYRGMIGSILYLTAIRADIAFIVSLCARFQSNPKESHLTTVKRILRYLKGSDDLCLFYPQSDIFDLVSYSDAYYVGHLVNCKSTSGIVRSVSKNELGFMELKEINHDCLVHCKSRVCGKCYILFPRPLDQATCKRL